MKTLKSGVLAVALAASAGCATVNYSSPGTLDGISIRGVEGRTAVQQVVINTSGYYVLWSLPLVSGDLRWDEGKQSINGGSAMFSDHVTVEALQSALLKIAESRNCDLADVHLADSDTSYAGSTGFPLLSWLFGSSQMCMSAILVPRDQAN